MNEKLITAEEARKFTKPDPKKSKKLAEIKQELTKLINTEITQGKTGISICVNSLENTVGLEEFGFISYWYEVKDWLEYNGYQVYLAIAYRNEIWINYKTKKEEKNN